MPCGNRPPIIELRFMATVEQEQLCQHNTDLLSVDVSLFSMMEYKSAKSEINPFPRGKNYLDTIECGFMGTKVTLRLLLTDINNTTM